MGKRHHKKNASDSREENANGDTAVEKEELKESDVVKEPVPKKPRTESSKPDSSSVTLEEFDEAVRNGIGMMGDGKPSLFLQKPLAVGEDPDKMKNFEKTVDLRQTLFWITGASTVKPKHVKVGTGKGPKLPPSFSTIAFVTISSLSEPLYRAVGGDEICPQLNRLFGDSSPIIPVKGPGSKTMVYNMLETLLRDGSTLPVVSPHHDLTSTGTPETWDDLVIGDSEYAAAFPFPADKVCMGGDYTYDILESHTRSEELGPEDPKRHVIGLDCEMVQTMYGLEIARVSIVDMEGTLLYDSTVIPTHPVTDYVTKFSGITKEILDKTTTTLEEVRKVILDQFIFKDTVVVGHGLENDLSKLHIAHRKVVDTSILFGRLSGGKYKLRELTRHFLRRDIQVEGKPHDSSEDAIACIDLVKLRLKNGMLWTNSQLNFNPRKDPPPSSSSDAAAEIPQEETKTLASLFTRLADEGLDCVVYDQTEFQSLFIPCTYERNPHISRRVVQSDVQTVSSVCKSFARMQEEHLPIPHFHWIRLDSLYFRARAIEAAQNKLGIGKTDSREEKYAVDDYGTGVKAIGDYIVKIYNALPDGALMIILGTETSTKTLWQAKYAYQHGQSTEEWTPALENLLMQRVDEARSLLIRYKVKLPQSGTSESTSSSSSSSS